MDIALELVEKLYVHLPLKRSMYAVNPLQRLRLLQRRISAPEVVPTPDRAFYSEMLAIFSQLRDLHTAFVLPEPLRSTTAYLPFKLEACFHRGTRLYVVSHLIRDPNETPDIERGAVVTHWNGIPIDRAVALNAERECGSNAAARHAQGLAAMTIRWLGQSLPPDEEWVDVRHEFDGKTRETRFQWKVFRQQQAEHEHAIALAQGRRLGALGMDARGEVERQVRQFLFQTGSGRRRKLVDTGDSEFPSRMPKVFTSCRNVATRHGTFGYLRIATFNVASDDVFLREFIRLAALLSRRGLILDLRGNTGGLIHAGERLLQLLTPRPIDPARFHFLNSVRTLQLTERHPFINQWQSSIGQAVETGTEYSHGFSLLKPSAYNNIGQKYQGPVLLVTDAMCYSTTDIFAAGFQDHRIGTVLGVDANTGAGGANVWEYRFIAELFANGRQFPASLPGNASFRFAVRRVTRIGANTGVLLEDLGVRPDKRHYLTRRDVLERNVDLIEKAAALLSRKPTQQLSAARSGQRQVRVRCDNLDRIDAYLDDRPLTSKAVRRRSLVITLGTKRPKARQLRLEGFRRGQLVAATRVALG